MSTTYNYAFADPARLAMVYGSKDPDLEAIVLATPRCWVSEDEHTEQQILAAIIGGTIGASVARDGHLYILVFHWIATAIGASADPDANDDDALALEGDVVRSVNPALERLGEPPLLEVVSPEHPFLPAKNLAARAAASVAYSMFSAADCDRTETLLSRRWADFSSDEIEAVGLLSRVLGRRRYYDVLLQLVF